MVEVRHLAAVEDCWGGKMFMYYSCTPPKKFPGLPPFPAWSFVSPLSGEETIGVFQYWPILGIGGFKFCNWGSRELSRKNTKLPHYLNGFPELLGMGLIMALSLSGDCAGAFLKFRWTVRKWCLEHAPKESTGWSTELLMHTLTVISTNNSREVLVPDQTMRPWTIQ